jgi:hypothetical protein
MRDDRRVTRRAAAALLGAVVAFAPLQLARAEDGLPPSEVPRRETQVDVDPLLVGLDPPRHGLGLVATARIIRVDDGVQLGGTVTFSAAGEAFCTVPTDLFAAEARCPIPATALQPALLAGGVTARYHGDWYHLPSTATGGLIG